MFSMVKSLRGGLLIIVICWTGVLSMFCVARRVAMVTPTVTVWPGCFCNLQRDLSFCNSQ